ncbi:MAG: hypothetical protein Q9163_000917 [Psora crenata]
MQSFKLSMVLITLTTYLTVTLATPAPVADPEPQLPNLPITVPAGLPTGITSLLTGIPISNAAGATSAIGALPTGVIPAVPGVPTTPIGGGLTVLGLSTNPSTVLNQISEAVEVLQYVAGLIQNLIQTGTVNIPGIVGVGLGVQGQYLVALLNLARTLVPAS